MRLFLAVLLSVSQLLLAFQPDSVPDYLNPQLDIESRVEDLVARMTLEEKVSQMANRAAAIPRLGIPEYNWWNECLHGVARAGIATVFPQAIGLAATWDTDLMFEIADVISTEARAKHHEFTRDGDREIFQGLTFWSPNINIFRDPRWGRGHETYGEDPYLTARMGVAFVKGLQGNDPKYLKTIATPKHYAVHSGPEPDRHTFDAVASSRDLCDTYLPAFEACIKEAGAYSVMCAYNRYLGDACCGSTTLLQKILRDDWGFEGYVVSDCGAISDIFRNHKIVNSVEEAAAIAVKSGTDLNCGGVYYYALVDAVKQGLVTEADIDISVKRLFKARFKLGMFDPPEMVGYAQIPYSENDSEEHRQLSVQAAWESIVLLKNKDHTLPLKKDLKKIAVIGPTADSYKMLLGNYNGTPSKFVTPLDGIRNKVGESTEVIFETGCNLAEKGAVVKQFSSRMLSTDGTPGLKMEFFRNQDLEGDAALIKNFPCDNDNWVWGSRVPNIWEEPEYSFRWSGQLRVPRSGPFNFLVEGNNGYRLFIDNKLVVDNWAVLQRTEEPFVKSNHLRLKKGKSYNIRVEYRNSYGLPELTVKWELLKVDNFKKAINLAQNADVVIFIGGITAQLEGEEMRVNYPGFSGGDRTSTDLPKVQEILLKEIYATGTPVVLVLSGGSALSVNWAEENIPAIVDLWYPGQEGGTALADVLFGDYNPAGRLPVTFYKSVEQLPSFKDYNMKGRTYRYFEGEALYPFGYGLSYSTFAYGDISGPQEIIAGDTVKISVTVTNTGKVAGDEVIQLYIKDLEASVVTPIHSLQGFKRIHLNPGQKQLVDFTILPKQFAIIDTETNRDAVQYIVEPGMIELAVGGTQPGTKSATTNYVSTVLEIKGEAFIVE